MMNCVLIVTNFNAGRKKAIKYKKKVIDFVLKYTKIGSMNILIALVNLFLPRFSGIR